MGQTFIYPRPEVLENPLAAAEVDEALERLAVELDLGNEVELRPPGSNSVIVPDTAPEEVWAALDRFLPIWKQARLFYLPRLDINPER
ncbi:MAG: hypothetical protein JST53_01690 [Actinobacteria bacterium]|nr:hypothetical protein [Actinomycetota bacterium]